MTEGGWVPNPEELTNCVLLIQALRDPTRSDHRMALSVSYTNSFSRCTRLFMIDNHKY
jgi:hypothetical protein